MFTSGRVGDVNYTGQQIRFWPKFSNSQTLKLQISQPKKIYV